MLSRPTLFEMSALLYNTYSNTGLDQNAFPNQSMPKNEIHPFCLPVWNPPSKISIKLTLVPCLIVSNNVRQQFQMGRNSLQSSSKSKMRKVPMASSLPTLQSRPHHFCWAHILLRASYQHCILISRSPLPHSDIQKCAKSLRKGGSTKIANQWTLKLTPYVRPVKIGANKTPFLLHGGRLKGQTERQRRLE